MTSRIFLTLWLASLCLASLSVYVTATTVHRNKREAITVDLQRSIAEQAAGDPVGAAVRAQNQDGIRNNVNGGGLPGGESLIAGDSWSASDPQDNQYAWNKNVLYYPNAAATPGDAEANGWVSLPQLDGFTLNRSVVRDNATLPYYVNDHDPTQIKKAVIIFPGMNRDSWKYTNLIRNSLNIALTNHPELGLTNGSVLIVGPAILNQLDVQYGAAEPNDIAWYGSQWSRGGLSRHPASLQDPISFFEVLDWLMDNLFDKTMYPNLNAVSIAGHSMGGQSVQRYALTKQRKSYDDNIHYLIQNPGAWTWLEDGRPTQNASCEDFDSWPYGLGGDRSDIPKYVRTQVLAAQPDQLDVFRSRKVYYAFGLLDNGPGDRHCEAVMQGGNHLDRGSNFVQSIARISGGFPAAHTLDLVAQVSHQDYAMLSSNASLIRLFKEGYDSRQPDISVASSSSTSNTGSSQDSRASSATTLHFYSVYSLGVTCLLTIIVALL
jgi:pimeloyl-ACP methyl ester carboxylesterase